MSEPQPPYGPPPGYGTGGGEGPGPRATGPAGYGLDPAGYGRQPLGPGWPDAPQEPYRGEPQTEAKAVVALVLAVLAYTPVVPFIGAVAALVLARYAQRDIERSAGGRTGLGLVRAARVLAWVHLLFVALLAVVLVVFVLLPLGLSA